MNKKSVYETWKDAGREFAIKAYESKKSIVELGEASYIYGSSRGLPNQDIIRMAFRDGWTLKNAIPVKIIKVTILKAPREKLKRGRKVGPKHEKTKMVNINI
jgi:hypothetical protein